MSKAPDGIARRKDNDRSWLARSLDAARTALGLKQETVNVKVHSNKGIAIPEPPTLNLDKGNSKELTNNKGAYLKMPKLTPAQINARDEKLHARSAELTKQSSNAISHTGGVREATTGRVYDRVNSQEKVAEEYVKEQSMKEKGMSL